MTDARTAVIHQWMQAKDAAEAWTKREAELRLFIAQQGWGFSREQQGAVGDGTHRLDIGNGWNLKLVVQTRYVVKDGQALRDALEAVRNLNSPLSKPLIDWKPSLSLTAYKEAPQHVLNLLAPAVTTSFNMPTLTLESPK